MLSRGHVSEEIGFLASPGPRILSAVTSKGIGVRVVAFRDAKAWTQYQLSKKATLTQSQLRKIETGENKNPGADVLMKLGDALGVPVDALLRDGYSSLGHEVESAETYGDVGQVKDEAGLIADGIKVPEIAREVAAGAERFPTPDSAGEKVFWFRPDFIRREAFGGSLPKTTWGRLAMVRLAKSKRAASSMLPTISPGAWLLVRMETITAPAQIQPRGIYLLLGDDSGLMVKRVTYQTGARGGLLLLESDNRAAEYAATALPLDEHAIADFVKAKVIWWSVMAKEHE